MEGDSAELLVAGGRERGRPRLALPGWGEETASEAERRPPPAPRIPSEHRGRSAPGPAPLLPAPRVQSPQLSSALAPSLARVRLHTPGKRSPLSPNWLSTEYPGDLYEIFSLVS